MGDVSAIPATTRSWGKTLARASWITFAAIVFANGSLRERLPYLVDLLALVGAIVGFVLGAIALLWIRHDGRKGILAPALAGILLNGLTVLIWVTNFLAYRARMRG